MNMLLIDLETNVTFLEIYRGRKKANGEEQIKEIYRKSVKFIALQTGSSEFLPSFRPSHHPQVNIVIY